MAGGTYALMAGGSLLFYSGGNNQFKERVLKRTKEDLVCDLSKLYAISKLLCISDENKIIICQSAVDLQLDHERNADNQYINNASDEGKESDNKALILRSYRKVIRGSL